MEGVAQMPRQSKNKFEIINNEIHITREGWPLIGLTTYREDYYKELSSKTWSLTKPNSDTEDKGYLSNGTLGLLHRYIAGKWYGEDVLKNMTEKGYVVDHMNNNHVDCRILGISEYLYRLRELALMYDGKIPLMVQERANWPKKIGRNEPCPCGSGKKYKFCHGKS